jgi:rhodanese-related sulfurtransferase
MPDEITWDRVKEMVSTGAQLVEVLPAREYQEELLPGAISIPLKHLTPETVAKLDQELPVIVYCWDYECDLSPRAAWRLESLGFKEVYDYAGGKADWLANGFATGRSARAANLMRHHYFELEPVDAVAADGELHGLSWSTENGHGTGG